jgi:hypothetical protein
VCNYLLSVVISNNFNREWFVFYVIIIT